MVGDDEAVTSETSIAIPQRGDDYWQGTDGALCPCGGTIVWAEAGYVPGSRACRRCLSLFSVRGRGADRRLVPQAVHDGIVEDANAGDDIYCVPGDLYPGFATEAE